MKTIGMLGGMGPEATADLYMEIVRIFQKRYGATLDKDYPPMLIYSMPLPDVVLEMEDEEKTLSALKLGCEKLEAAGVDFIGIACNTMEYFVPALRKEIRIPILSIAEETAKVADKYVCVGLLSTTVTSEKGTFDRAIQSLVKLDRVDQEKLTQIIVNILAGKKQAEDKEKLLEIVSKLKSRGAGAIIVGCTDLPLLLKQTDTETPLINTTEVLASAMVRETRQTNKKPQCEVINNG